MMSQCQNPLVPAVVLATSSSRRQLRGWSFRVVLLLASAFAAAASATLAGETAPPRPNLVILLCDNLGYGDVGCFGSPQHRTPCIDRLAGEGIRLTDFYSASGVCTPSRASLLTGCYPRRVGLDRTDPDGAVLRPMSPNGLHPDETTIAEILRDAGYATACIGKWHLGDQPAFLPTRQGFSEFFGIPYSDDMVPRAGQPWPPLPLMRGERVIEAPVDRDRLTQRYTGEAIRFLRENRERPLFLYLAHAMPGSTNRPFSSEAFRGRSANGAYGDSVEELDWSTGEVLTELRRLELDDRTLVVWTSDNGAPRRNPPQGSNGPLSGWGYSTREGGMRVPCIARWPGRIPAGATCDEVASLMDLLPTFARLAGAALPRDRNLDGRDIWPLLSGQPGATSPHEAFFYYHMDQLQAVRSAGWKLYLPLAAQKTDLRGAVRAAEAELYDLRRDPGEKRDLAAERLDVVQRLLELADRARADLGDGASRGPGQRPVGRVDDPQPRLLEP